MNDDEKKALEFFSTTGNVVVDNKLNYIGESFVGWPTTPVHPAYPDTTLSPSTFQYPGQLANPVNPTPEEIMYEITNLQYRISDLYNKMIELKEMSKKFLPSEEKGERRKLPEVEKKS